MENGLSNIEDQKGSARAEIRGRAERLWGLWNEGNADPDFRHRAEQELGRLRQLYREEPSAFDASTLATLQRVSIALKETAPTPQLTLLRSLFGFESFRPGQREIIDAIIARRDCVGIMPTGAGKSLTYQLPARLLGGLTLVISPLIALMKDQVDALCEIGIRATSLNSSLSLEERQARISAIIGGEYELVYAAPEGIEASVGNVLARSDLRFIAVDEAHCISQWGHDFRPAYRNLLGLKKRFGQVPVLALTATATEAVTRDIIAQLGMVQPLQFRGSFFRPNLRIETLKKGEGKDSARESIARFILNHRSEPGIVYCLSRKGVDSLSAYLRSRGIRALAYHAGMESEERSAAQDAFRRDDCEVIVATVAFGMGIDKSNVRYVIHRDMPKSIESYYQEIGRAGRDGVESDCVLFYSWADVIAYDRFADASEDEELAAQYRRQARSMFDFAESGRCRHRTLVRHFGEQIDNCKAACDACGGARFLARTKQEKTPPTNKIVVPKILPSKAAPHDPVLFEALKALRRRIADERDVPAYIVFSDAVLLEMAARRPQTDMELLGISGIGPKKLALYGKVFLAALREAKNVAAADAAEI